MSAPQPNGAISLQRARPEDAAECGRICYEAFRTINAEHNFPPEMPGPEVGVAILEAMFSHPSFFAVVARHGGKIIGSNCMDERGSIFGIGPITVDPSAQNFGTGKFLMQAVLDRAAEKKAAGVRLVQAAFHRRSLSLYTKLGFDVQEPLATMNGPAITKSLADYTVRAAMETDLAACDRLCFRVHGHTRSGELADALKQGNAKVVERQGRITAYSSALAYFGHSVGETNEDLQALIASADAFGGPGILIPMRNSGLFRWCLDHGLRVVTPMTLMSMGLY